MTNNTPQQATPPPAQPPPPEQQPYGNYGGYNQYGYGAYGHSHGGLSPKRLVQFALRHIRTFILAALFGALAAYYWLSITTPMYRATAKIEMAVLRPRIMDRDEAILDEGGGRNSDEILNTRLAKLQGRRSMERLLKELDDPEIKKIYDLPAVRFSRANKSRIVTVTCEDVSATRSAIIANTMAELAETITAEENRGESDKAVNWLKDQAVSQAKALSALDAKLTAHRVRYKLGMLESRRATFETTVHGLSERIAELEGQLVLEREVFGALSVLGEDFTAASSLPAGIPSTDELKAKLAVWQQAETERNSLKVKYREEHPKVVAANQLIAAREQEVLDIVGRVADGSKSTMALLEGQIGKLREEIDARRSDITKLEGSIREAANQQASLERERQAADMSYQGILQRIEEARLSADEDTAVVKLVEAAQPPSVPFAPEPLRIYPIAIVLALIAGCGLAFVSDMLSDTITAAEDIEQGLGLNILGIVPVVQRSVRRDLALCCLKGSSPVITEAFATIRAVLNSPEYKKSSQSLVVTSCAPEDGKTITSVNLAASYARSDLKTLLIDMDLRRPQLGVIFERQRKQTSLTHLLSDHDRCNPEGFQALAKPAESLPALHVITSVSDPNTHPSDLIASKAMHAFIKWATETYDQVIIDAPPLGLLSDAAVIGGQVGGILLVTRADRTRKHAVQKTVHHIEDTSCKLLGTIVNAVPLRSSSYFGRSSYYHKDYYHNRYIENGEETLKA